jgi:hypothetical protein
MVTIQKRRAISILALLPKAYGSSLTVTAHFELGMLHHQVVSASNYIFIFFRGDTNYLQKYVNNDFFLITLIVINSVSYLFLHCIIIVHVF